MRQRRITFTPKQNAIIKLAESSNQEMPRAEIARRVAKRFGSCSRTLVSKVLDAVDIVPVKPDTMSMKTWRGLSDRERHRISMETLKEVRLGVQVIRCNGCRKQRPADRRYFKVHGRHPNGDIQYHRVCKRCEKQAAVVNPE